MRADVVVDIGNTRVKWGRCGLSKLIEATALGADQDDWVRQLNQWGIGTQRLTWVIAGVVPNRVKEFANWAAQRGDCAQVIDSYKQLPIDVEVDAPESVGVDRLLNAVAAFEYLEECQPGLIVDAGSAMTVDSVVGPRAFLGGAIVPGFHLMAKALREYTARLPEVTFQAEDKTVTYPGKNTEQAIRAGIFTALEGCVRACAARNGFGRRGKSHLHTRLFLTGGDSAILASAFEGGFGEIRKVIHAESLTLEGIRIAAESLP